MSPRATPSHRPSSISVGRRRVIACSSEWNCAPCARSASSTSLPEPAVGSAGTAKPRWACSNLGMSARSMNVIGVRLEGVLPERWGSPAAGSLAAVARVAVDARQQPPRAPLLTAPVLEAPADREAARAKRLQRDVHRAGRQAAAGAQLVDREWPRHVEMALDERNLHLVRGALLG